MQRGLCRSTLPFAWSMCVPLLRSHTARRQWLNMSAVLSSEVVSFLYVDLWSMVGETRDSSSVMPQGQEVLGGSFGSDTAYRETNPCLAAKSQVRKELLARDLI